MGNFISGVELLDDLADMIDLFTISASEIHEVGKPGVDWQGGRCEWGRRWARDAGSRGGGGLGGLGVHGVGGLEGSHGNVALVVAKGVHEVGVGGAGGRWLRR